MSFSENLRYAIDLSGMTTKELSQKTGISENTINSYLKTNGSLPNIEIGYKLASTLKVSVKFLVEGIDEKFKDNASSNNEELLAKHLKTISNLDSLPEYQQKSIESMISELSNNFK